MQKPLIKERVSRDTRSPQPVPHVLQDHVRMPIERLDSGQDLPIVAAVDEHLASRDSGEPEGPFCLGSNGTNTATHCL